MAKSSWRANILELILLDSRGDGRYEIVARERRYRGAGMVGLEAVPALVLNGANVRQTSVAGREEAPAPAAGSLLTRPAPKRLVLSCGRPAPFRKALVGQKPRQVLGLC